MAMVKSNEKKNVKIIFLWLWALQCSETSLRSEFWKDGKNDGFWLLWGIFKEYVKQNIIAAVLIKANAHSVAIGGFKKYQSCK